MREEKRAEPESVLSLPWLEELDQPVSDEAIARVLDGLDDEQRAAVTHGEGPLLVVAGAGSGKTKVIAHRIAYLIAAKRARPSEILALTFTERAAAEMEARVDVLVPYGYTDMWISTFHAFGDRLYREFALELGLPDTAEVLSEAERVVFFRERLFRLPLRHYLPLANPVRHLAALVRVTARAKDEGVTPDRYLAHAREALARAEERGAEERRAEERRAEERRAEERRAEDRGAEDRTAEDPVAELARARRQLEVAEAYRVMDEELHAAGKIDFGDQILLALRLLDECPHVLDAVRRRFRYILVDEFQDTNAVQFEMLKLLASDHRSITVVGDDDQSIYKFRGAAIGNILGFTEEYPERSRVVLTRSYRSGQPILDAAYRLIQHNNPERLEVREGIEKRLRSVVDTPGTVEHHRYDTIAAEAEAVAGRIRDLVQSGIALREIGVLVRSNRDAEPFLVALTAAGIPHEFSGSRGLFQREEVGLCMSFLRAVTRPGDAQSLYLLMASDVYRMPMEDLFRLADLARFRHRSLRWTLDEIARGMVEDGEESPAPLTDEGLRVATRVHRDLTLYAEESRRRTTGELLYQFLTGTGYLAELTAAETLEAEEKIRNIARFFDQITRYRGIALADRAHAFVDHLDLLIEAGDDPQAVEPDPDLQAVRVLTVHRAKGLEFEVVFVVNLVSLKFPTQGRGDAIELPAELYRTKVAAGNFHLAEERRLFYVAMTRAREFLVMTSAADHGGARLRKLSPFVVEALDLPAGGGPPATGGAIGVIERHAGRAETPPPATRVAGPEGILRLSATRIETYGKCPLRYKYTHVLRVPAIPHHSQSYGVAMHAAIAHLLEGRLRGSVPPLTEVAARFRGAWRSEGFLSREHEERRLLAGLRTLERFYGEEIASPVIAAQVEKEFSFVHGKGTRIDGRFDRVDLDPDGATVIDYKTSAVRDQADAEKKVRQSCQLRIYALAYEQQAGVVPRRLELRFVESGLTGGMTPTSEDLAAARTLIERTATGIRAGSFEAQPSLSNCGICLYSRICPSAIH